MLRPPFDSIAAQRHSPVQMPPSGVTHRQTRVNSSTLTTAQDEVGLGRVLGPGC